MTLSIKNLVKFLPLYKIFHDNMDGPNNEIQKITMTSLKYIKIQETWLFFILHCINASIHVCTLFNIRMDGVFLWRWRIFVTVLLKVFLRNLSFASTTTPTGEKCRNFLDYRLAWNLCNDEEMDECLWRS